MALERNAGELVTFGQVQMIDKAAGREAIREAGVDAGELELFQALREDGRLSLRWFVVPTDHGGDGRGGRHVVVRAGRRLRRASLVDRLDLLGQRRWIRRDRESSTHDSMVAEPTDKQ